MVTINNRVVLMNVLADDSMYVYKLLRKDKNATAKAVTAAITKYGYYPYFGDVNCKFGELDDYIERAPKDQRGKNGYL